MFDDRITPFFMIEKNILDDGLKKTKDALSSYWPNSIIGYSYKTNALPWVIEYFKDNGCYAEVVSDDEYNLAKSIGVSIDHIIYNGIAKSKETFLEAVKNHAIVNIDSEYEIDWLEELESSSEKYEVGIRVNFDIEQACPGQTNGGNKGSRFGFCYENGELKRAIDRIESKGVQVRGIHLHYSSITRMPNIYEAIARAAVNVVSDCNLELKYVDIGGGFYGGLDSKPQFAEYFEKVRNILVERMNPEKTILIVEPGMALIGAPVSFVTRVLDIKETNRERFIITDGSRMQIDPLMHKTSYFYDIIKSDNVSGHRRAVVKNQVFSGYTCMEQDWLFELKDSEEVLPGDMIVYHKVGAYTMCLSPLFIKWFPDVYVHDDSTVKKVRNRWDESLIKGGSFFK